MVVEMRFNKMTPLWNAEESIEKYFDEPECFVGFRYLVVRVMSRPRRWSADELARIGKVVRDVLEPGLGPAVCEEWEEDGGGCIEYHPWSSAGQQSYRLEPVLYLKRAAWESHRRVGVRDEDDE